MNAQRFNQEQIEAIEFGEGPLLIIAGAGTGKTMVITERIKHLILQKGVKPEEVLALTFTEKAAYEMQERVDKLMPYGYTQMWISTFHSFCDTFLRDESLHIGINPNYKLMTEAESVLFLKKNIFKLHLDYFRPLGNPVKFLEALLVHFSRLKDEDITPAEYLSYAQSLAHELEKKKEENREEEEIKKTIELAGAYRAYEELKVQEGVFDFSDLISHTLNLLRTRKNVLKKYQEQFKYILVDEFQDTNYAQNALAILLSGQRKNITVVADDDQAIYRWRGAALSNVMQFKNNFPGAHSITLRRNYRSTQTILDHAYTLIQHNNPNRLETIENVSKKLVAARRVKGAPIEFIHTNRVDEEAEAIAKKIGELVKNGEYKYSDIAILVRANNHAQPITHTLTRFKIPYQFLGPAQLFHQEEIKDLIAYLKVLYNLEDSVSLFRVLSMDIFSLSVRDISTLLTLSKRRGLTLFEALEKVEETRLSDEATQKVTRIVKMILRHLERVKKDTAGQLLYYFLVDSGLFTQLVEKHTAKEEQVAQNVARFFDKIKTFETTTHDTHLYAVVDWIDLMMEMGESPLVSETDWRDTNAVNILTIHSSKGLEFPVVFMPNLVVDRFPTRERREKIPIPPNLIKEILPLGDYHLQEERRLFYVGMTRAKDLLFFTAASFYAEGKREKKVSPFVYEALPTLQTSGKEKERIPTQLSLIDITREYDQETSAHHDTSSLTPFKIASLSFSQLQAFDICPLHYRARFILRLPTPVSAPLSFGISIHAALKDFYEFQKQGNTPTLQDFLAFLRKNWVSEGYQEKTYEQKMFERGEAIVKNYYEKYFDPKKTPLSLELPFSFYLDPTLKITGKIDRVDGLPGHAIEIIDYKTGQVDHNSKHSYTLQLGIYALAATRVAHVALRRKPEDITVTLFYLEPGEKVTRKVTKETLEEVENSLRKKVKEIEASDFKCSKSVLCLNCEYKMLCNTT